MNTSERVQTLVFEKYEGLRNDFVVLDERNGTAAPSLSVQARVALCDRHAGVGADGVLTLLSPRVPDAIVRMHVTNADGSVPEMCGNGLRCVSRWLLDHDLIALDDPHFVDTDAGPLRCVVEESGVRVQMRGATTTGVCSDGPLVDEQIEVEGETFSATALSVGNPHFVLEGPAHRGLALRAGPVLEHHARFPARTNVEFVSVRSPTELDLFVWERGAGLTQACGTGAAATVAALVLRGRCPPNEAITVHLPGGDLTIVASADLQRIEMVGPARRVFTGTILRG